MEVELSLKDCQEALERDPNNAAARLQLGNGERERGNLEEAAGHFRALLDLLPHRSEPRLMLAEVLQLQGRSLEALALYQQAVEKDPKGVPGLTALGLTYLTAECFDPLQAEHCFRRALAEQDQDGRLWQYLGRALLVEQASLAVEPLLRSCELDGEEAESHFLLAVAYRESGQAIQALPPLLRALQRDAQRARWWDQLGCLYLDQLDLPQLAVSAFETALACADAQDSFALANLFWALLEVGELERAQELRPQVVGLEPVGDELCDAALEVVFEGSQAALERVEALEVTEEYAVDWGRLKRLAWQRKRASVPACEARGPTTDKGV